MARFLAQDRRYGIVLHIRSRQVEMDADEACHQRQSSSQQLHFQQSIRVIIVPDELSHPSRLLSSI
jgi:hypothetical protein